MTSTKDRPTCGKCTSHGIHRFGEYYSHSVLRPTYDRLTAENMSVATEASP